MLGDFAGESSVGRVFTQPKMSRRTVCRIASLGFLGASGMFAGGELLAAPPSSAVAEAGDLFAALKAGDVEARVVARDQHHVRVFLKNPSKRPLSVKLPDVLAARPILAQGFFGQQGNGQGFNSTTSSQQPAQAVGGPMSTGSSRGSCQLLLDGQGHQASAPNYLLNNPTKAPLPRILPAMAAITAARVSGGDWPTAGTSMVASSA